MCGICGKLSFEGPARREEVARMNEAMLHRGPDEDGFYESPDRSCALAMRRLKIIDLSTGSQPLFNETGTIAVILNGEIYNYLELRSELESLGHKFRTHSDTETLVHAYEAYGLEGIKKLNGMFAFALWDSGNRRLVLARDRMGIKPLYYRLDPRGIAFASEIKALLRDPDTKKEIDLEALDDYFSLLYVPGPRSIFRSIKKLDPGCALVCEAATRRVRIEPYWTCPIPVASGDGIWESWKNPLDALFRDALRLQLRSDVPNGLFLSSGLDSAAICYYASQVSSRKIRAFTVRFESGSGEASSYNEDEGACAIARACGADHHPIVLRPKAEPIILKAAEFFDEPFADTSALPTFLLCESARKEITVALSGEGGDELFGGYPTYIATRWVRAYRRLPGILRQAVAASVRQLPVSWSRLSWEFKLKQFAYGAQFPPERAHPAWKEIFSEKDKEGLYDPTFLAGRRGHDAFESFERAFSQAERRTDLGALLYVDQNTYLLDQFLVKSDRMSMANSLEVRVPILDHRIVELAAQMPPRFKLRRMTTKWTLRKLLEGKLPKEILWGGKKGFSPPIPAWIAGELRPFLESLLAPERVRKTGLLNPDFVQTVMGEHFSKKRDHHRRLWALLHFVLWHERWM